MSGTAGKREPLVWRRAAPRVSVCLARAPGESKRCERPQGASMYGDGVKYPHTVSEYWIQAGASMRILNTGLARYPKSIRVSMRLPDRGCVHDIPPHSKHHHARHCLYSTAGSRVLTPHFAHRSRQSDVKEVDGCSTSCRGMSRGSMVN